MITPEILKTELIVGGTILAIHFLLITFFLITDRDNYKYNKSLYLADAISSYVLFLMTCTILSIGYYVIKYNIDLSVAKFTIITVGKYISIIILWIWGGSSIVKDVRDNSQMRSHLIDGDRSGILNIHMTSFEYFYKREMYDNEVKKLHKHYHKHITNG